MPKTFDEKLEESGLTKKDATRFGIHKLSAKQTTQQLDKKYPVPSMRFDYFTPAGVRRKDICRFRLLSNPKGSFGEYKKVPKYLQPSGSPTVAYFPKEVPWKEFLKDPTQQIIITEGELKACCASKLLLPTIGLGGVFSFQSKKKGIDFLPELARIEWNRRDVVICFDSDAIDNPHVAGAQARLCKKLSEYGAIPKVVTLPPLPDGTKVGLDDFLVAEGVEAFKEIVDKTPNDELSRKFHEFNGRYVTIKNPGFFIDEQMPHLDPVSLNTFRSVQHSNLFAMEVVPSNNGHGPTMKKTSVVKTYLEHPQRRQYSHVTYIPGAPRVVDGAYNQWEGWAVEPRKGTVQPWYDLVDLLFDGAEEEHKLWLLRWLGRPLRYPGTKNLSAVGMWSVHKGQGKSLVGNTMERIYGSAYSCISQRDFESSFNSWARNKQFVMVDEVCSDDSRLKADILKKYITQEKMRINIKNVSEYDLPDHINYYLTSNRANAFRVEEGDRRFFIHEVTAKKAKSTFYKRYYKWLDGSGPSHMLYHYQNDFDFGDFSAHEEPPMTAAKQEMIDSVKPEGALWVTMLKRDPDAVLSINGVNPSCDFYTVSELCNIFDLDRKGHPMTPNRLGIHLKEAGFEFPGGRPMIRFGDSTRRYYIVRNHKKWRNASLDQIKKHLVKTSTVKEKKY